MDFKSLTEELKQFLEGTPTYLQNGVLSDEDIKKAEKVTLDNLDKCYKDPKRNLWTKFTPNGKTEIIDGFDQEEVEEAIKNGNDVYCL